MALPVQQHVGEGGEGGLLPDAVLLFGAGPKGTGLGLAGGCWAGGVFGCYGAVVDGVC